MYVNGLYAVHTFVNSFINTALSLHHTYHQQQLSTITNTNEQRKITRVNTKKVINATL